MAKRLVVCCDGTWNTPDQKAPTNVTKLALAVAPDDEGVTQRMFYHRGVGTKRSERIRGGAFGVGLSRDVRDVYRFLVANFEPGDEIFFFGFSRGAFTARSCAGFVRNSGILRAEHADRVDEAYALYRSRQAHPRGIEAQLFRRSYSYETRIRFIGVWDTVGALGIPLSGLRFINFLNRHHQFHDTELSTWVDAAFQALSIDEKRQPFRPAVWNVQPSPTPQQVEQVWFAGVHCDVGGGYREHGLSDIALRWMVGKAQAHGLAIDETALAAGPFAGTPDASQGEPKPDPLAEQHETRTGFYKLLSAYHRPIDRDASRCEWVSSSALERAEKMPAYHPPNLVTYLDGEHHVMDV
jgi:uncharacterized protein (DUF2235 family)